jgi:8-oxo-dGTP diphosphatase
LYFSPVNVERAEGWMKVPVFGARSANRKWLIRPSAYGLLEDRDGRVAVVRSRDGVFLPGGGMEAGETPQDAIRREALEECGLILRPGPWAMRAVQFAYSTSERAHFEKRSTFMECAIEGSDRTRLEAGHELLWVDVETAARILTHPSHAWAVEQWRKHSAGSLRGFLVGGDRRSIARSARAGALVRSKPELVAELAGLTADEDWLVSQRALDLLEKIAHEHPEWIEPHQRVFIGPLADSDKWEVRLQIVRALPLFPWRAAERSRVLAILRRDVRHPQTFVKAWALDSLATFAEKDPALRRAVLRHLRSFERSGSKALAARARHVRERLRKA